MVSNRNLLFQGSIFRCYVSFREGTTHGFLVFHRDLSEAPPPKNLRFRDEIRLPDLALRAKTVPTHTHTHTNTHTHTAPHRFYLKSSSLLGGSSQLVSG